MPLRLGIDFGTATTCVASVLNAGDLTPQVVVLDGSAPFVDSLVWVSQPTAEPIVQSRHESGRSPMAVFAPAGQAFSEYWKRRVATQADGIKWSRWLRDGKEQSMLLSYFKPELADDPVLRTHRFPEHVTSSFDPISQSADVHIDYATRVIADPAPDTNDLVAATAAILRSVVAEAARQHNSPVDALVIGVPSHQASSNSKEARQAIDRRLEAVALSRIGADFGSPGFSVKTCGEAQAAGFGLDLESDVDEAFSLIVDCGAGTTDMALLPYRRAAGRRLVAQDPIVYDSVRFAGRNINEAIAKALREDGRVRRAYNAMDSRAWQILMDDDIERIKRGLRHEERDFKIRFRTHADSVDTGLWDDERRAALHRYVELTRSLESRDIKVEVQRACRQWIEGVVDFLAMAKRYLGPHDPAAIEMVGGAFKFEPLRGALRSAATQAGFGAIHIRYRTEHDESQTIVARGLARRAALMP